MNKQDFKFTWDINNIIDKTNHSKDLKKPIEISNNGLTATRHERVQGDDYPPVRIYSNNYISLDLLLNQPNNNIEWSIHIDSTHGYTEIGILEPSIHHSYFIKGFKNEAQIEDSKDIKTIEYGETFSSGDTIKVKLQLNSSKDSCSIHLFKNGKSLGSTPFKDVHLNESSKIYPFVGLNDDKDQISIVY